MARSILAVIAGYFTMLVLVTGGLGFLFLVAFDRFPTEPGAYTGPAWVLWVELALGLAAAVAGGWVCARLAPRRPMQHALVLVGVLLVLGAVNIVAEAGLKPLWSAIGLMLCAPLGVLAGAWLRARRAL